MSKKKSLSKLARQPRTIAETFSHLFDAGRYDDRSFAIIAAVEVERALERRLFYHFDFKRRDEEELFIGAQAPLSSLSAKIKIAYALALIDNDMRADLDAIRTIRNVFAHAEKPYTFETQEIADECKKLRLPPDKKLGWTARERFDECARHLDHQLTEDTHMKAMGELASEIQNRQDS